MTKLSLVLKGTKVGLVLLQAAFFSVYCLSRMIIPEWNGGKMPRKVIRENTRTRKAKIMEATDEFLVLFDFNSTFSVIRE